MSSPLEIKTYGMIAVLAILLGFGALVLNIEQTSGLKSRLNELKASVPGYKRSLESLTLRRDTLEADLKRVEALGLIQDETIALSARKTEASKAASTGLEAMEAVEKEFTDTVSRVRGQATGKVLPTLMLRSGKQLSNAKVQSITDTFITVIHSEGTARLKFADLPEELIARFRIVEPPPAPPVARTDSAPGQPAPPPVEAPKSKEQLDSLRTALASARAQLVLADNTRSLWERKVGELKSREYSSRSSGRISALGPKITEMQKNADAASQSAATLRARIVQLQNLIMNAETGQP